MQTSLHIYALVRELRDLLTGTRLIDTEFYKKEREAYLYFKNKKGVLALGMIYHPVGHGCFLIPRGKVKVRTNEKPWPFFQTAYETRVTDITQLGLDRIFKIGLKSNDDAFSIIVEAIGPHGNLWLTDNNGLIQATLRNRKYDATKPYRPPDLPDKKNPFELDLTHMIEMFRAADQFPSNVMKKNILGLDDFLIAEILTRAGVDPKISASELRNGEIKNILTELKDILRLFGDYDRGYFYCCAKGNIAFPFKLRSLDEEAVKCKSLSLAVHESIRTRRIERGEVEQKQQIIDAVKRYHKRIKRKIKKIENDLTTARDFEQYKKFAELIQINLSTIKKGQEKLEVADIYSDDRRKIKIDLDPALTPARNAERYFKKYRKGRDALKLLERRLEVAQDELTEAGQMADEIETDYDNAVKKYETEIEQILPRTREKKAPAVRLPYREHTLSTGVTIFVGKDGADNDTTTFRHARPYEYWFHASQCPGSHVVMKFPSKTFQPSRAEIEETAAVAAYHSKARHSARVPVIYTQRKYVRKPRNAKPGLVTVQREKMVMVEPKKSVI